MMAYLMTSSEQGDTLRHYGILGMRWGVRHDKPSLGRKPKRQIQNETHELAKRANSDMRSLQSKAAYRPLRRDELQRMNDLLNVQKNMAYTQAAKTQKIQNVLGVVNAGVGLAISIDSALGNPAMQKISAALKMNPLTIEKAIQQAQTSGKASVEAARVSAETKALITDALQKKNSAKP
jgi:hypothetical protein